MKRRIILNIIAIVLTLAISTVSVSAAQCSKYSTCRAGTLYVESTGHLEANADDTYTYLGRTSAVVRYDHVVGEAMEEADLTITLYDQNGNKIAYTSLKGANAGEYANLTVTASAMLAQNVTSVTAKYTVYGYNSRSECYMYFNPADITITAAECEQ